MSSNKCCCNCCNDYENSKRRRALNIEPRAVIDKENIIQQRRSCGCARKSSSDIKTNFGCCQPRRNSEIISQCSVNRNQIKATVSGVNSKIKSVNRPPLADLKEKSNNIQCCSTAKNSCGAVKKVTITKTQSSSNRRSAPLAVSTTKKNPTRSSFGTATSTQLYSKTSRNFAPSTPSAVVVETQPRLRFCASTSTEKFSSLIPILEQNIHIPSKQELEKTVNILSDSYSYGSANSDLSFHSPLDTTDTWLTFRSNEANVSLQFSLKKEKCEKCINDDSDLVLDNEPIQIIFDGIPFLKKEIMTNQLNVSSGYKGIVNLDPWTNKIYPSILYSSYMIDIVKKIIAKEENLKINKDLMIQSYTHPIYRTAVINWLIKLQQYLNSDASVFFICIRLFDKLLANTEIPQELLQLTGMIAYWIANKYGDCVEYLTVTKLQEICCDRYSARYIIMYERKILKMLNYDICVEEPIIFVHYYIYLLQIEDSNDMSFCANYLLDCVATSSDINTFALSLQACAAVYLSLQFLGSTLNIWQKLESYPGFYTHNDLYIINEKMIEKMLLIQSENYEFREVFVKYACKKYNYISVRVCEGLKNLK